MEKFYSPTVNCKIRINLPLCYCILFKLKNLQLGMLILLRVCKTIILLWIKANVVNGLKFIFLVKIILKKFISIKKNHFKKSKLFKKAQYPNAWKEGVGVIHIKPFSKSKNMAKIILVYDILNLMCLKCKINHLQIIFHHNDVIFIANILYDISVSALSVVNFLYIYKCNLSCRSPLEKNKKRKEMCWYFILLEMVDVIN